MSDSFSYSGSILIRADRTAALLAYTADNGIPADNLDLVRDVLGTDDYLPTTDHDGFTEFSLDLAVGGHNKVVHHLGVLAEHAAGRVIVDDLVSGPTMWVLAGGTVHAIDAEVAYPGQEQHTPAIEAYINGTQAPVAA